MASAPKKDDEMKTEHPLHRAFARRPYLTGFAVTFTSFMATGGFRALFTAMLPEGPRIEAVAAGLQQTVLIVILVALLWRMDWIQKARIWSRPQRPATWWPLLILPAGLIPFAGLLDVNRTKTTAIIASIFDYTTTGIVEEIVFRGLILTGIGIGLAGKHHATRNAIIASSILFGLPHVAPVGIVFAAVFGLSFAALTLSTNTIWTAIAIHIAFDLFTDLPDATAGVSGRWYKFVPFLFVLASGIVTVVRTQRNATGTANYVMEI
jgi:membrane protease YdiL (CAAX protease family)